VNRGREVCWSAPRELFKLTETVETLTERAIADSDMIDGLNLPESNGWPFDSASWTTTDPQARESQRSHLLEALDTDKNLIESFPPELPSTEKLEIVCEVLLRFLDSLSDGIITQPLWERLEEDVLARKQSIDPEEERAWVLDVLSSSPNHNISFVFLTSMLSKIAGELGTVPEWSSRSVTGSTKSSIDLRRSLSFKGRTAPVSEDPSIIKRHAMNRRYAEIFAPVIIRGPASTKEKERKATEERKREIIEIFVQGNREGALG